MEENKMDSFCMKCKKIVTIKNDRVEEKQTKRGMRKLLKGECSVCGTKTVKILANAKGE